jgi:hypothetical protein
MRGRSPSSTDPSNAFHGSSSCIDAWILAVNGTVFIQIFTKKSALEKIFLIDLNANKKA